MALSAPDRIWYSFQSVFFETVVLLVLSGMLPLAAQPATAGADVTVAVTADADSVEDKSQDTTVITRKEIESLHARTVQEVLQKNGCNIKRYGSYGSTSTVYIRGLSGSCVAILIDGVQVNSLQTGAFDLTRINIDDIERIELVRGASDNRYTVSGAVGGIINIVTRKGDGKKTSIYGSIENTSYRTDSAAGIFDTQTCSLGTAFALGASRWNVSGAYTGARNSFPYEYYNGDIRNRDEADAYTGTSAVRGVFPLPDAAKLSVGGDLYYGDVLCPGEMTSTVTGEQKDTFVSSSVSLDVPYAGAGNLETQAQLSYKYDRTGYIENIDDDSVGSSLHQLHTLAAQNRWTWYASNTLALTAAADTVVDYLDSTDSGTHALPGAGLSLSADLAVGDSIRMYPSCKVLYGSAGIVPVPKLGLSWTIIPEFAVSANVYRMFTVPTLNQLYWSDSSYAKGNRDLDNEDGIGGDLIFSYKRETVGEASLSVFTAYYKNKIQWATDTDGKWTPSNTGKAVWYGGTVAAKTDSEKFLSVGGTYNLTMTYLLTGDLTLADDKRIMYTPVHTWSAFAAVTLKKLKLMCTGTYTGLRYISNLNKSYLDPYFLLDVSADYHVMEPVTLYAAVKNLLDTTYYETDGYPMPGMSLTVGLRALVDR